MYRREEGREEGQREGTGARQGLGKERERAVVEEGLAKGTGRVLGFWVRSATKFGGRLLCATNVEQ